MDRPLLLAATALLGIGLLVLYSASFQKAQALGVNFMTRQLTWILLGGGLAVLVVVVDYHRWLEWAYLAYGLNLLLLALVLEMGVVRGGAQRWLTIGSLTIQPSELAKVTTILALARCLGSLPAPQRAWRQAGLSSPRIGAQAGGFAGWKALLRTGAFLGGPILLILKEPNLGTALVFVPIALAMLLAWGIPLKTLGFFLMAGIGLAPFGWMSLAEYQRSRLLVFLNPNLDPLGAGYTVVQSKIAVGSGGLFGKGWLAGTQNQLNFLPERHTDFIFSVVGEEWGFLGTTLCLGLFGLLLYRGILMATQTRDPFGRLLVVGLVALLATHVVVNTGMTIGLMPVVGLPLPFLSYGGSWGLTCLVSIGMILSVGVRRPVF